MTNIERHDGRQFGPERRETEASTVVRVVPVTYNIPAALRNGNFVDPGELRFTSTYMILKSNRAKNPGQLMFPGGNLSERDKDNFDTARREIQEELHIDYVMLPEDNSILLQRPYSISDRNINEVTVKAQTPPFLEPVAARPEDKVAAVIAFSYDELELLFERESIEIHGILPVILQDSLSSHAPGKAAKKAKVSYNPDLNKDYKETVLMHVLDEEIQKKYRFIRRAFDNLGIRHSYDSNGFVEMMGAEYFRYKRGNTLNYKKQLLKKMDSYFINMHIYSGSSNTEFHNALRVSAEEVYFEESLAFIENSGPQKPFLAAQMLLELSDITPYELSLLEKKVPELYALLKSVANVCSIKTGQNGWYELVKDKLRYYRDIAINASGENTPQMIEEYKEFQWFTSFAFASEFGIQAVSDPTKGETADFGRWAKQASQFIHYLQEPLGRKISPELAHQILQHPFYTEHGSLDKYIFEIFGINPFQGPTEVNNEIRWQALRQLLTIIAAKKNDRHYNEILSQNVDVWTGAFLASVNEPRTGVIFDPSLAGSVTTLRRSQPIEIHLGSSIFSINPSDLPIHTFGRIKAKRSYDRAILERKEPKDVFGQAIILDPTYIFSQQLPPILRRLAVELEDLGRSYRIDPQIELKRMISAKVIEELLIQYLSEALRNGSITISNIQETGGMKGVLTNIERTLMERTRAIREKITINREHKPSAASSPKFSWLKMVLELEPDALSARTGTTMELQIFPTQEDFFAKKEDDPNFAYKRLWQPHDKGRFAPATVMFGKNTRYADLLRQIHS